MNLPSGDLVQIINHNFWHLLGAFFSGVVLRGLIKKRVVN